jgi:putative nucleotidyltransferase with HDIG domain
MTSRLRFPADPDPNAVAVFVTTVTCAASVLIALTASRSWSHIAVCPGDFATFAVLTFVLQVVVVDVYGRGTVSTAGIGLLAIGMTFGVGPAAIVGAVCGFVLMARMRSPVHRGVFNAANFALSAAAAAGTYELFGTGHGAAYELGPSLAAAAAYSIVNSALLTTAMALSEGTKPFALWNERFRWLTPYYLIAGPFALAVVTAYQQVGLIGMVAFTAPPVMLLLTINQYVRKTAQSVVEVRQANDELRRANADLRDLFEFAAGLAAQTHGGQAMLPYVESALGDLLDARVSLSLGSVGPGQVPLVSGGRIVGGLEVNGGDLERWSRLRDAIEPQLATALESAALVEQVRKTHLETIGALSRSMEAKDYYTGGHTERVSTIAVALARRLGYQGADLDAIEIGALLHDIGKIGIPEGILHKPGPLSEGEWAVMKEHPVISHVILSEVELPKAVLEIARHSHERMDGNGYPDALRGEQIPLAARIVLVADAVDALTSDRPYRNGRSSREAIAEIRRHTGTQFCPGVVAALEQVYREEPALLGRDEDEQPRSLYAA